MNVVECYHCYSFDYEWKYKLCKICNVKYCFDDRNYHIMFHYERCNDKFKQGIIPILENFIFKDIVQNILLPFVKL